MAVHRPQFHQYVPDIGLQAGNGGGRRAGRRGGARVLRALLLARCARALGAARVLTLAGRPLPLIPADAGRGGRGAAWQPVNEAWGSLRGGGDHRVEARAARGAGARGPAGGK